MRILYLSQYFPPEAGATQTRAYEMARNLVLAGHQVTMLAEFPNHPSGIIPDEYRGRLYERADLDGIDVIRVWVKASPVKTMMNRMAFYLSYMVNATVAGVAMARGPFDFVYATSPPLFTGGAGVALSWLKRTRFVFEVRDLWPESAVALGELKGDRAIAWATRLEEMCYNRASKIIVVTEGSRRRLIERGYSEADIELIPNGSNVSQFRPRPEEGARLRVEMGLEAKFLVLYAGNHGIAQGLDTILEVARLLRDLPDVQIVLVGEGPEKAELQRLRDQDGLSNLTLLAERPTDEIPAYLSAADVALVPLRKRELFLDVVPSKMYDAWACACPTVVSVDGEARRILESAQAGLFAEPDDAHEIALAIKALRADPDRAAQLGRNGRAYVEQHHSRERMPQRLEQVLLGICDGS